MNNSTEPVRTASRRWFPNDDDVTWKITQGEDQVVSFAQAVHTLVGQGRFPGLRQCQRPGDEPWTVVGYDYAFEPVRQLQRELHIAGERIVEVHHDNSYVVMFTRGGLVHRKTVGGRCHKCRQTTPDRDFAVWENGEQIRAIFGHWDDRRPLSIDS